LLLLPKSPHGTDGSFAGTILSIVSQVELSVSAVYTAGFIAPCLPTKTDKLPSDDLWLQEIKHDGFRVIARKDGDRVRLYSRPGNDLTGASS
jgi:ATP-dependent DNA ligase